MAVLEVLLGAAPALVVPPGIWIRHAYLFEAAS